MLAAPCRRRKWAAALNALLGECRGWGSKSYCAFKRMLFVRHRAHAATTQSLLSFTVVLRRAAGNHIFRGQPEAGAGSNMSGNPTNQELARRTS